MQTGIVFSIPMSEGISNIKERLFHAWGNNTLQRKITTLNSAILKIWFYPFGETKRMQVEWKEALVKVL